jgi:hypothetical protein
MQMHLDIERVTTDHADIKSMKPYIDTTEVAKRDAISLMELPSRRNENKQLLFGYLD